MGLPSTRTLLSWFTALVAESARAKVIVAIPRLVPPGPYEISALLTGPIDLLKYSYCFKKTSLVN
jgi:hypothetical protein